jgi:hypothetical protein
MVAFQHGRKPLEGGSSGSLAVEEGKVGSKVVGISRHEG